MTSLAGRSGRMLTATGESQVSHASLNTQGLILTSVFPPCSVAIVIPPSQFRSDAYIIEFNGDFQQLGRSVNSHYKHRRSNYLRNLMDSKPRENAVNWTKPAHHW